MPDKLSIINDELLLTGNNPVSEADDGSNEWNVCSAAYETAIESLFDEHDWKFLTGIVEVQERLGDSPDPSFADMYAKPDGCLHVVWVKAIGGAALDWKIVGNRILVNCDSGILVKCDLEPSSPSDWPGSFLKVLRHSVKAGIYRGLAKSPQDARAEEKAAEYYLAKARPRTDAEEPPRPRFISDLARARSRRRG